MRWLNTLLQGLRSRKRRGASELTTEALEDLQSRLSYDFKEPALLIQALKHRSYVYARQGRGVEANERLEYLGDAVLDLVVAEFLYRRFKDRREGDLTQMKSLVVSRAVLSRKSGSIDLGNFLLLSQEERGADNGGVQSSILSDGFEAIIGAMYLDGGLEAARQFIERVVLDGANFECPLLAESGPLKQRSSASLRVRFREKQTFRSWPFRNQSGTAVIHPKSGESP